AHAVLSVSLVFSFFLFLVSRLPSFSTLFPYTNALPISSKAEGDGRSPAGAFPITSAFGSATKPEHLDFPFTKLESSTECVDDPRSEEHTSELQSRENLVCRLLLEKKNI